MKSLKGPIKGSYSYHTLYGMDVCMRNTLVVFVSLEIVMK